MQGFLRVSYEILTLYIRQIQPKSLSNLELLLIQQALNNFLLSILIYCFKPAFPITKRSDIFYSSGILLNRALESVKATPIAIVTPSAPIQVTEESDTFSTKIPPIPAPAAIANCITD